MKTFKYKFTPLIKALIIFGMALCGIGFGLNLYNCLKNGVKSAADPVYPALQYALMFLITVVLFVLLITVLLNSSYVIDGKVFKTKFGLIVSKYDVEKITQITLDRKTNKLTVTFDNNEFMVIVVKQEWYDEFVNALLAANNKIEYTVNSLDSNDLDKDKK